MLDPAHGFPEEWTDLDFIDDDDEGLAARHLYRIRVLVRRWRYVEDWLRRKATPGEVAAYEAAVALGLDHLQRYGAVQDLIHHFWNDPACVAPAPGMVPRLVEPPWIDGARRLHGREHRLVPMAIEALADGRRLRQLLAEQLATAPS